MKTDQLETAIYSEIARVMTVGYDYVSPEGYTQTREPQIKPLLNGWISDNRAKIVTEVIKKVGEKEIVTLIADHVIKNLTEAPNSYSKNYEAEALYKAVAPLVADAMAEKLTERHREEMCKKD